MAVYLSSLGGSVSIGVYSLATDNLVIVPKWVPLRKAQRFADWLHVKLAHTMIGGSVLAGALVCANSHGLVLPNYVRDDEVDALQKVFDGNITIMETRKTAFGNLVLANDFGAIVDPRLKDVEVEQISGTLGVEAVRGEVAEMPYVGSLAVATNKGTLAHPLLTDSERKVLEDVLKVPVDVGTINCGNPFVGTGLICNRNGAIAGSMTTGPELFIIGNALDVVEEQEQTLAH